MPEEIQVTPDAEGILPPSSQQPAATQGERPEWLDSKFESGEALQKSYNELAKRLGQGPQSEPEAQAEPEAPAPSAPPSKEGLEIKPKESVAPDVLQLAQEQYSKNGQLSEDMYSQLNKVGYPQEVVDSYLAGQQALGAQYASEIMGVAGGQENYEKMIDWAENNLSSEDQGAFNKAVQGSDLASASLAVRGLMHQFRATPQGQVRYEGMSGGPAVKPITDKAELMQIMQSRRYKESESYQAEIKERLRAGAPLNVVSNKR